MREELEILLKKHNFSAEEMDRLFSFMMRLTPLERQMLFLALKGFPEYLPVFKNILAAKLELIKQPNQTKLAGILNEEEKILAKMMEDLNQESRQI